MQMADAGPGIDRANVLAGYLVISLGRRIERVARVGHRAVAGDGDDELIHGGSSSGVLGLFVWREGASPGDSQGAQHDHCNESEREGWAASPGRQSQHNFRTPPTHLAEDRAGK